MIWEGNYGLSLRITKQQAFTGFHSGACDKDIASLSKLPVIKRQLKKLDPELLKKELKPYGEWNDEQLNNHADNLDRVLWLACADIVEGNV